MLMMKKEVSMLESGVSDGVNSYQGADEEEEGLVLESGVSDDGKRSSRRFVENGGRNAKKEQLHAHQEKLLFSTPFPLKMENKNGVKKSKAVFT